MSERKKILWLVSWYPNKYNPFDGDFIQRHAKAAALYTDIHVLFVKLSEKQAQREEVITTGNGLTEKIIYLPKKTGLGAAFQNAKAWQQACRQSIKFILQNDRPALLHVHIPWKVGLLALWAKRYFRLPYIVTEHWGIYNNVVEDSITTRPFLVRKLLKRVYLQSAAFVSVSRYLGEGVNATLVKKAYTVIPNVVDTNLFYAQKEKHQRFTFLHVSNMVPLKNVDGILEAFKSFLTTTGADAQLILVGNKESTYEFAARELNLAGTSVFFKGEIPYAGVAEEMRRCHAFVLNSNMENSPCVIGEALCCGLPVIATGVGGIPELLNEKTGLLVPPKNVAALARAMATVYGNIHLFPAGEIAVQAAEKFSTRRIGEAFSRLYAETR